LRQLTPAAMKSRTVSGATPVLAERVDELLRAHVGLAGEGGDALLDLLGGRQHAEAFGRLPLEAFVDERLARLGHHLAGRVEQRQEAAALLDLVIRHDVVIDAHGDGEGALRGRLRCGGQDEGRGEDRGEREEADGVGGGSCHGVLIGCCRVRCKGLPEAHRRSGARLSTGRCGCGCAPRAWRRTR
jgi:hypothetical protein